MRRSEGRILTTHTGSLPRPSELTRLYVRRARGESVDPAELERLGREALRWVVRKQAEVGVDIPSDGEYGKLGWTNYVGARLSGLQPRTLRPGDPEPINPRTARNHISRSLRCQQAAPSRCGCFVGAHSRSAGT